MRKKGLISGNYAITNWIIKKNLLDDLLDLSDDDKVVTKKSVCDYQIRVAYQIPIKVTHLDVEVEALARTFEDSLIYTNWDVLSKLNATDPGQLLKKLLDGFDAKKSFDFLKTTIFNELKKSEVKAEFALDLIFSIAPEEIAVPQYINKGLTWLESVLCTEVN